MKDILTPQQQQEINESTSLSLIFKNLIIHNIRYFWISGIYLWTLLKILGNYTKYLFKSIKDKDWKKDIQDTQKK